MLSFLKSVPRERYRYERRNVHRLVFAIPLPERVTHRFRDRCQNSLIQEWLPNMSDATRGDTVEEARARLRVLARIQWECSHASATQLRGERASGPTFVNNCRDRVPPLHKLSNTLDGLKQHHLLNNLNMPLAILTLRHRRNRHDITRRRNIDRKRDPRTRLRLLIKARTPISGANRRIPADLRPNTKPLTLEGLVIHARALRCHMIQRKTHTKTRIRRRECIQIIRGRVIRR